MGKTKIEWANYTWGPLRVRVREDAAAIATAKGYTSLVQIATRMAGHIGPHCERVSAGCGDSTGGGCYSENNNSRCLPANGTGLPFDRRSRDLIEPFVDEHILKQPLHWKTPRTVFPCSQTDLFGEWYTDEMIDRVFAVMALTPRHTYLPLTKRAARLLDYIKQRRFVQIALAAERILGTYALRDTRWPLHNVRPGFSAEDQSRHDERWAYVKQLARDGWLTWCSYEPALAPVDFRFALSTGLRWVVCGAESGPGARPFNEDWARSTRDQCVAAGVRFFYKQNAQNGHKIPTPELDGQKWMQFPVPSDYPQTEAMRRQNERDAEAEVAFQERVGSILGIEDEANTCPLCYGPHDVKDCPCAKKEVRHGRN